MISGSKCPKSKNLEIWNYGDPKILFLESVIFLYKFFTNSVISGSKHPKSENSKICSCLLVLSLCLLMLARQWPCPSPCSLPKIQILECVSSLHKFCTKSVISGSKCPKLKKWKSGILGILNSYFWKVSFSFIISSQNRWYLARNDQNGKIPNLLALARACLCSACAC